MGALLAGEARLISYENIDIEKSYVVNGVVFSKTDMVLAIDKTQITADGTDECLVTGIPSGTTIEWPDGQTDEVPDGEVRFAVDLPGTYTLVFEAVEYLRKEVTIEAVPAAES